MSSTPAKLGRKSKLTPERQNQICTHLRAGVPIDTVCAMVGIGQATFQEWVARGEARDRDRPGAPAFAEFARAVQKARAEGEGWHLLNIRKHAIDTWQASAWYLERVYPQKYALRRPVEVTGPGGQPVQVEDVTLRARILRYTSIVEAVLAERDAGELDSDRAVIALDSPRAD